MDCSLLASFHFTVYLLQFHLYSFFYFVMCYLQESHSSPLSGAVSLCNPFNLVIADEDFHKGFNNVYDKALAKSLCNIFKK